MGLFTTIKILHFSDVYLEGDFFYAIFIISAFLDQINHHNPISSHGFSNVIIFLLNIFIGRRIKLLILLPNVPIMEIVSE